MCDNSMKYVTNQLLSPALHSCKKKPVRLHPEELNFKAKKKKKKKAGGFLLCFGTDGTIMMEQNKTKNKKKNDES